MSNTSANSQILAVDIGNTSAHFAWMVRGRVKKEFRTATRGISQNAPAIIKKLAIKGVPTAIISSVVPSAGLSLKKILRRAGLNAVLAGRDIPIPVVNRYKNPKQVGVDRLINALAAYHHYRRELIILDFGTAITFDVIAKNGDYLGGVIAPGIEISLDALFQRTALLPKTKLAHPREVIGRDTVESIRIGCSTGIGGLCDRVVHEIKDQHSMRPLVLATGGYAHFMKKYCDSIDKIEPDLILRGLWLLSRRI